jgi:hypothetical protein
MENKRVKILELERKITSTRRRMEDAIFRLESKEIERWKKKHNEEKDMFDLCFRYHYDVWLDGKGTDTELFRRYREFIKAYPRSRRVGSAYLHMILAATQHYEKPHPGKKFPKEQFWKIIRNGFEWSVSFLDKRELNEWPKISEDIYYPFLSNNGVHMVVGSYVAQRSEGTEMEQALIQVLKAAYQMKMPHFIKIIDKQIELGWETVKKNTSEYEQKVEREAKYRFKEAHNLYNWLASADLFSTEKQRKRLFFYPQTSKKPFEQGLREYNRVKEMMEYSFRINLRLVFLKAQQKEDKDLTALFILEGGDDFALQYILENIRESKYKKELTQALRNYTKESSIPEKYASIIKELTQNN